MRARRGPGSPQLHELGFTRGAALRRRRQRRRRRHRLDVPAPRRARGLRPAAGPAGHHGRPARHVPQGRLRRADDARDGRRLVRREARVTTNPLRRRPPAGAPAPPPRRLPPRPGRRWRRRDESLMVPDVSFDSYYGRHIVKPAPWEKEVAAYLFLGGIAAGSALLGAGGAGSRLPRAAARRAHRRRRRRRPRRGGAGQGPRQAEPRPQHDAHRQAHLADVGRARGS